MSGMEALTPIDPRVEMFQKGQPTDSFFNMKALAPRPVSDVTEMFDTDFEDDDSEDDDNSPRLSFNSTGRRSETTLSSFEEVHTPSPNSQEFTGFNFELASGKRSVEGPRGPHLFRSSFDSTLQSQEEDILTLSPMTPRPSSIQRAAVDAPRVPQIPQHHRTISSLPNAVEYLDLGEVAYWTPQEVAAWMYNAGFEPSIVEKFEENDISGEILITLKFEDLRELDIPSFGQRTKVWNEIHVLRGSAPSTPKPTTPIDETTSPCVEFRSSRHPSRHTSTREKSHECGSDEEPRRRKNSKRRHPRRNEPITPLESVSIVGIEQLMPKPHKCAKGENCSKWRKQQRLIDSFNKEHPVSPEGYMWVAGDPGNAATTDAIADGLRPVSDAVPSVVASSDVLGPSFPAFRHLEEATLRNVQLRDPQDNVKQFIQFQHIDPSWSSEQPPTPPYEMFPDLQPPHNGLRSLPRLAIPQGTRLVPPPRSASASNFSPYAMERIQAKSPELRNATQSPSSVYRFGTPFSEMDIPVTAVPIGPISREASQSVPPNMSYRHGSTPIQQVQRTQSRASARRPSFAMPRVDENISTSPPRSLTPPTAIPTTAVNHKHTSSYPWSPVDKPVVRGSDDTVHSGWMKKRKTRMLRHEWHEHHFTLSGTKLSMHKDARALETLESIDVDDYAIACSSLASGSKLNAAFKAMSISLGKDKKADEAAFAFQLIPAVMEKSVRLRKKENEGFGKGSAKTHYFAVRSRDDRIDWMRELMLAKALKQKSEGYEVNLNGHMI